MSKGRHVLPDTLGTRSPPFEDPGGRDPRSQPTRASRGHRLWNLLSTHRTPRSGKRVPFQTPESRGHV